MKKIAVIVYPHFSLYEVTCLTEALMWFESPVEIFASSREPVRSEDGFLVTADKTLDEFSAGDYACVVLPGMMIPFPALFDRKLIDFLASLKGKELLIAAISAGPMLLAKAGLLEDVHFTSGIWEEICQLVYEEVPNITFGARINPIVYQKYVHNLFDTKQKFYWNTWIDGESAS